MIDAEDLPSIELACRLRNRTYSDACRYCLELADSNLLAQDEPWDKLLASAVAGYVAGVRHERKRQRQKHQITDEELALVQAYRITDDSERHFLLNFAKVTLEYAEKSAQIKYLLKKIKKKPADAATRQQACTE